MPSNLPIQVFTYWLLVLTSLFATASYANPPPDNDIDVSVQVSGDIVTVDLNMLVPAARQQVWAVLTDFDHMADFVTNLTESKIASVLNGTMIVSQRGSAHFGPLSFDFNSMREIRLAAYNQIQSHLISGNMRKLDGVTRLQDEGEQTRVVYHSESIPGTWLPPVVGKNFIEHEIRGQYAQIRNEVVKRKSLNLQLPRS